MSPYVPAHGDEQEIEPLPRHIPQLVAGNSLDTVGIVSAVAWPHDHSRGMQLLWPGRVRIGAPDK